MAYQLHGEPLLIAWLATEARRDMQDRVLAWVAQLLQDPAAIESERLPGPPADVRVAFVPETDVAVTFFVVDQYRVVRLMEVRSL
ncbi:MAG: hypothetical protein ACRDH5_12085 [bacterium]